jgi:hypothetical protein
VTGPPKAHPVRSRRRGEFFRGTLSQHPQIILLDDRDPGIGDGHRHRLGRAFGWRDQRAARRDLELLRDRMRQDSALVYENRSGLVNLANNVRRNYSDPFKLTASSQRVGDVIIEPTD